MSTIIIDNTEYQMDQLSDNAKALINNLRFTDSEIARLQAQVAVAQTARATYANALKAELSKA